MYFPNCTSPIGIFPDKKSKVNPVLVPCGKCRACKISRASAWSLRSMMEYKAVDEKACFLTLTYDDSSIVDGMLRKRDLQLFFKRCRKAGLRFRYFACGEYGETTARPHFHVLVFGVDFDQMEQLLTHREYLSNGVRGSLGLWNYGFVHLGHVSEASCQYVAKYMLKSDMPSSFFERYGCKQFKPFQVMSRRPALGNCYMVRYWKRILDGRDPLIRLCSMDENKTPVIPRFVRERCEEIEFFASDYDPAVKELQEIRADRRRKSAEAYCKRVMDERGYDMCQFTQFQIELNRQRDLNLGSLPNKKGCL